MATNHIHRLLILAPTGGKTNFLNNWINTNWDSTGSNWLIVPLSADGTTPATHYMCDASLTEPQIKQFFQMLKQQTGSDFPNEWDTYTRNQKVTWIRDTAIPWLWSNYELGLLHVNNDGDWNEHTVSSKLSNLGLQQIVPE